MGMKAKEFGVIGVPHRDKVRRMRQTQAAEMRIKKAYRNKKTPTEKDMVLVYGPDLKGWDATMAEKAKEAKA